MAITLRQESATGATTKSASLNFAELDNNFIDLLSNKIQAIDLNGDTGQTTLGQALANEKFTIAGGTGITTALTSDSAGQAVLTINQDTADTNTTYTVSAVDSGSDAIIRLTGSDASTDDITLVAGSNITLTPSGDNITIAATDTGITDVVQDTTPQLGGNLDAQSYNITSLGTINTHTIPGGTGTFALTSDIPTVIDTQIVGGTDITVSQPDSAGSFTVAYSGSAISNVVEDTTPQLGGTLDGQANTVQDIKLENYKETIYALSYGATISPDVANGNVQEITLTGNVNFGGFTNAEDGQSLTLIIHQDGTGSRTFTETLDSANRMLFAGGTSTLSTAGGSTDIMSIVYAGGIYYASLSTNFS